jgi:hypothetical protein
VCIEATRLLRDCIVLDMVSSCAEVLAASYMLGVLLEYGPVVAFCRG